MAADVITIDVVGAESPIGTFAAGSLTSDGSGSSLDNYIELGFKPKMIEFFKLNATYHDVWTWFEPMTAASYIKSVGGSGGDVTTTGASGPTAFAGGYVDATYGTKKAGIKVPAAFVGTSETWYWRAAR